jgi:hypothetical protein
MDNQGNMYGYGGQGSCPASEQWEFPLSATLEELENDNISQVAVPFIIHLYFLVNIVYHRWWDSGSRTISGCNEPRR